MLVVNEEPPLFKRAHIGILLELPQFENSIRDLDLYEICSREELANDLKISKIKPISSFQFMM